MQGLSTTESVVLAIAIIATIGSGLATLAALLGARSENISSRGHSPNKVRRVVIEELLGRTPTRVDMDLIASYTTGERILVTGAGGSIGSELCRQLVALNPESLILLGRDENDIFWIASEMRSDFGFLPETVIADIRDRGRMESVFTEFRPTVVFHSAANKHVPLMESNSPEAVTTNVFGTRCVAELSITYGVKRFVMVSTDKVVNPCSVMGATKRVAELVVQGLAQTIEHGRNQVFHQLSWDIESPDVHSVPTIFSAVRFGNVLGSRGSVIPLIQKQIETGGPVTITHPEMVRFFLTIPEAVQLVIQAGGMASGGEIFALNMGKPVKILDIAHNLIRLSGFEPGVDIQVVVTGIRPGEKLYEEMLLADEGAIPTDHEKIFVAQNEPVDLNLLLTNLARLERAAEVGNAKKIRHTLENIVPTYRPVKAVSAIEPTSIASQLMHEDNSAYAQHWLGVGESMVQSTN